jgi:RNA polymerase sigma-70 factor (ECF subfamily)
MNVALSLPFPPQRRPSPESLVRAAQQGDRGAFEALYRQYGRMVHGILVAHAPWQEADDLTQEVFLMALENLRTLRDPGSFSAWLVSIARNVARGHHRRRRPVAELAERADPRGSGEEEAFRVLDQIRELPEAYRETLVLRLVEGMTGPEIAGRTGLTAESVRVNLCRGMKMLRERLGHGRS